MALLTLCLAACAAPTRQQTPREPAPHGGPPTTVQPTPSTTVSKAPPTNTKPGGYYSDDGPANGPFPVDLDSLPEPTPRAEPLHRFANNPYNALGRTYTPIVPPAPYKARGVASWYGRKFHGLRTSSGEVYDMFAFSAAHPTLPIPSYVRVTNLGNRKTLVVRINDRGPFHADRLIDLSYAAAHRLGFAGRGSTEVEVEALQTGTPPPGDPILAVARRETPETNPEEAPQLKPATVLAVKDAGPPPEPRPAQRVARADATSGTGRQTYIQLGAYGARLNAERHRSKLMEGLDWLKDKLEVVAGDGVFRLQLGPYKDRSEAQTVVGRLRDALDVRPLLLER